MTGAQAAVCGCVGGGRRQRRAVCTRDGKGARGGDRAAQRCMHGGGATAKCAGGGGVHAGNAGVRMDTWAVTGTCGDVWAAVGLCMRVCEW